MSFSSKAARRFWVGVLLTLALLAGDVDRPTETDMPWSAPATWRAPCPFRVGT